MEPLRIAVAGLGRMVSAPHGHTCMQLHTFDKVQFIDTEQGRRHVQNLIYRVPRASVVAVCSTEPHELEWARGFDEYKEFNVTVYDSYEAMLSHPGLQAVWISTSTDVHASQTMGAIKKGLHVLCEKPLSTKMEEVCQLHPAFEPSKLGLLRRGR